MAKRQKQTAKGENTSDSKDGIDRLSILPDELLVSILSLLTLKEATATSILSRRWRYLWTLLVKLDFDGKESLLKVMNAASESTLDEERCNYVGWVDDVMSTLQHKGSLSSIEEFRVFFNLTRVHKKRIDKWLQHAVADNKKKIRRLELKLVNYFHTESREHDECYTFPDKLLLSGNNFEFLKSLSLYYVNVNGEALECLLCNSLHLEELSVSRSGRLSALKIIRPCPSFKRLEISLCHNLNSVEIRHSKIVYLKYEGFRIHHFVLENVPFLVELCIGGVLTARMRHVLAMFASYLPQLEIFKINFYTCITWKETAMFYSAVKMNNLKQLVVEFSIDEIVSLLPLTNLICASPCLQRFVLEASHCYSDFERIRTMRTETVRRPYHRLEVVEFVEYRGAICELELITHILENVLVLKEIRVDPHLRDEWYNWEKTTQDKMGARARAKNQLTKIVPPNINLKIL